MATLECKCGYILSNTSAPNAVQYHVYSDYEWEKILKNDYIHTTDIQKPSYDVWICPNCHRIYVFSDEGVVIKIYRIED
jgi:hypothetical protein